MIGATLRITADAVKSSLFAVCASMAMLLWTVPAAAQSSSTDLAKQLANPIASLISMPFQFNWDSGYGPADGSRAFVNVQPVIPVSISEDWNMISRTIVPVIWQDNDVPGGEQFGFGDTVQSLFFSPKKPTNGVIWGVGPVALVPTATDTSLGSEQWGFGPTGVALIQSGPWTYGALLNHVWSVAGGDGKAKVNATFLQPFLNYTTQNATTFFLNMESTYDWTGGEASIPINVGVNQLFEIGGQKLQIGAGLRWWAASTDNGPEGVGARLNLVFLFPK